MEHYLDELAPVGLELISRGGLELGGAGGHVLALEPPVGDDVPPEDLPQALLVAEQLVESVHRDLRKGLEAVQGFAAPSSSTSGLGIAVSW
jgi:hypothetical protein